MTRQPESNQINVEIKCGNKIKILELNVGTKFWNQIKCSNIFNNVGIKKKESILFTIMLGTEEKVTCVKKYENQYSGLD